MSSARGPEHSRRRLLGWTGAALGLAAGAAVTGAPEARAATSTATSTSTSTATSTATAAAPAVTPAAHAGVPRAASSVRGVLGSRARRNALALTIDDGPHPTWTPKVLDLLAEHGVSATFSIVGAQATAYPRLVRRVVRAGHGVCNHSMTHPQPFGARSTAAIRREIAGAQSAISDAVGEEPTLFRAPGGNWTAAVLDITDELGLRPVGWSVDPRDWSLPGVPAIEHTLLTAGAGDILLCHDGGGNRAQTVTALDAVLPQLQAAGLRFQVL